MSSEDDDLKRVTEALNSLGEHFDSVHIFATRHEPATENGTVAVQRGVGNWFARYGQVREWVLKRDESSREQARRDYDA